MLKELIKIANELDGRGLIGEADSIDKIIGAFIKEASGGDLIDLSEFREKKQRDNILNDDNYNYLIVLDDGETYSDEASVVKVNTGELEEIWEGSKASNIVPEDHNTEDPRWISVWDLINEGDLRSPK
jgi:hypothetical protein